ncbi:MAG: NADH-quinone oxidoreductase subunit K [Candidatus Hydrothermales bacterium]
MNIEIFSVILTFFISLLIILLKRSFVYFLIAMEIAFNSLLILFAMNIKEKGFEYSNFFIYVLAVVAAETVIGLSILLILTKERESDNYDI